MKKKVIKLSAWTEVCAAVASGELDLGTHPNGMDASEILLDDMYAAGKELARGTCTYCWWPRKGGCLCDKTGSPSSRPPRPPRRRAPDPGFGLA